MTRLTIAYANHRPETLPLSKPIMEAHEQIILEEPPHLRNEGRAMALVNQLNFSQCRKLFMEIRDKSEKEAQQLTQEQAAMKRPMQWIVATWFAAFCINSAGAGEADVTEVKIDKQAPGNYDIEVTVQHSDEGWNHYADKWEVLDEKGTVLATRVLHHPHVNEQPFTRGLSGVKIPEGVAAISLRAHDSVHGHGGRTVTVELP